MRRRTVLALLGTTLAGCSGAEDSTRPGGTARATDPGSTAGSPGTGTGVTSRRTPTSTPPPASVGETVRFASGDSLTVSAVHFRVIVVTRPYPDALAPAASPGSQYVLCTVPVSGPDALAPPPDSFRLLVDDEVYEGQGRVVGDEIGLGMVTSNDVIGFPPPEAVDRDRPAGTVAFRVPTDRSPDSVAVEWRGGDATARWEFEGSLVDALASPPEFDVLDVEQPRPFQCGEPFPVSITVGNDGGRPGFFAATLRTRTEDHPALVELSVPAGGRTTWDGSLEYPPRLQADRTCADSLESVTFRLDWALGTHSIRVDRRRRES